VAKTKFTISVGYVTIIIDIPKWLKLWIKNLSI